MLILALVAGALAPSQPKYAAALVVTVCLLLLVAVRLESLLIILTATMFVESFSLGGGLHVDRLAGGFAAVVLCYLFFARRRMLQLRMSALLVLVVCYGAWMLSSAYWASDGSVALSEMAPYGLTVFYMLAFALLVRSRDDLRAVLMTLAYGALLFGVVALITYVVSHGTSRSSGLQGDPNYFAAYQVLALPAALVLASSERRTGRRWLYYGIVGVIIISVLSSQSRGGLIGLLVVLVATLVWSWRAFFRNPRQKAGYVAAVLAMLAIAVLVGTDGGSLQRVGTLLHPFSGTDRGSGRLDVWSAALRVWKLHPWLGIGAYNFRAHSLAILQATPGVNTAAHYVTPGREVHNAYLETLTELGVVGMALFGLIIAVSGWYFLRTFRDASRAGDVVMRHWCAALFLGLVGVAITSFFLSNELGRALWILVGLALALDTAGRSMIRGSPAPRSKSPPCASAR